MRTLNSANAMQTFVRERHAETNRLASIYSSGTARPLVLETCLHNKPLNSLSISPLSMSSLIAFGLRPSTWQPVENAVPKISLTVPFKSFDIDLNRILRAISMISSSGIDFVCLMFFSFFLSRGGSLRALMTSEDADGTTETAACRFLIVRRTVTRRPFCNDHIRSCNAMEASSLSLNATYPITGCLRNIFTDLLWRKTKRTDLWRKSRRSTDFTSSGSKMNDLLLVGIEFWSCYHQSLCP